MINTVQIKAEQLKYGTYCVGSGLKTIFIIGSCRAVPYLTYLSDWNKQNGNPFTIHFVDPFNWNWDMDGVRTDYEAELTKQESNGYLITAILKTDIFIHEFYANAGMFNVDKSKGKNIYDFGMNPEKDLCLPNFNDVFILTREICQFDMNCRKMAIQDYNVIGKLSNETLTEIEKVRQANLDKFREICNLSSFPEFAIFFFREYKERRYFWTFNHVSKEFNKNIFYMVAERIGIDISNYSLDETDLFANNYTHLCEYDEGYNWGEKIKPLREIL